MLDNLDQRIIAALVDNARISLKDLAQQSGLSSPSVSERLHRLEDRGVVRSFTIDISPKALGYSLQAIVRIRPLPGMLHVVERMIQETPEFVECDKVTGEDCFIGRLYVRSMDQLDEILDRISDKAETNTAIVKNQPVKRRLPPLA
jgi:Lrp/AsnC family transcriptional regulator, leucine-responsive regulatory protein